MVSPGRLLGLVVLSSCVACRGWFLSSWADFSAFYFGGIFRCPVFALAGRPGRRGSSGSGENGVVQRGWISFAPVGGVRTSLPIAVAQDLGADLRRAGPRRRSPSRRTWSTRTWSTRTWPIVWSLLMAWSVRLWECAGWVWVRCWWVLSRCRCCGGGWVLPGLFVVVVLLLGCQVSALSTPLNRSIRDPSARGWGLVKIWGSVPLLSVLHRSKEFQRLLPRWMIRLFGVVH